MSNRTIIIIVVVAVLTIPVLIIGGAVVVTALISSKVSDQEAVFKAKQQELEAKMNLNYQMTPVVFSTKAISTDEDIPEDGVESRQLEATSAPTNSIANVTLVVGRRLRTAVKEGAIITQENLAPQAVQSPSRKLRRKS
jgi:flagella basal body P-ring formation protein FlgA